MPPFFKALVVSACGLATALLTGIFVTVIERTTGLSIHTLSVWLVIPVGAGITGFASASGFYFASLYLHARPTKLTALQVIVIGGLSYFLIHYIEYFTLVLDDGTRARDVIGFGPYLDFVLTKAHYRVGRGMGTDTGEIGKLGYALAVIQVLGFLTGGFLAYWNLKTQPFCGRCDKFLRPLGKTAKTFVDSGAATSYHDTLFKLPADSPEFAAMAAKRQDAKPTKGVVQLVMKLFGCPQCKAQAIRKTVQIHTGRDWKDVNSLEALVPVPAGVNLVPAFKSK